MAEKPQVKAGQPVVLITGDDDVLREQAMLHAIEVLLDGADRSLALEELGASQLTADREHDIAPLVDAAQTAPFLTERRVVVGRHLGMFGSKDAIAPLVARDPFEGVRSILRYVQFCIHYVRDPKRELLDSGPAALVRGFGDCDCKARLFVALCLALGIEADLDPVFQGSEFPHVRAKVRLFGVWLRCDPCIINSDVGMIGTSRPLKTYL